MLKSISWEACFVIYNKKHGENHDERCLFRSIRSWILPFYSDMTCRIFKFGCEQIFETLWPPSVHRDDGVSRFLWNTEAQSTSTWPPHNGINSRFIDISNWIRSRLRFRLHRHPVERIKRLTTQRGVLLHMLIVAKITKKFFSFYGPDSLFPGPKQPTPEPRLNQVSSVSTLISYFNRHFTIFLWIVYPRTTTLTDIGRKRTQVIIQNWPLFLGFYVDLCGQLQGHYFENCT